VPKCLSVSSSVTPAATEGSARISRIAKVRIDQQNSGSRDQPMPGARMLRIVTYRLIAPRIEESPVRWIR
jgi:hypothetical protein